MDLTLKLNATWQDFDFEYDSPESQLEIGNYRALVTQQRNGKWSASAVGLGTTTNLAFTKTHDHDTKELAQRWAEATITLDAEQ